MIRHLGTTLREDAEARGFGPGDLRPDSPTPVRDLAGEDPWGTAIPDPPHWSTDPDTVYARTLRKANP